MIIQFCGMSGSGKTTIARIAQKKLSQLKIPVEVIDGDEYRLELNSDLGFSKSDRYTNIKRLAFVASKLSKHGIVAIICAINPYEEFREEIKRAYPNTKTVFISCPLNILIQRDTKGLYQRAMLPDTHPNKLTNLSGINDPFEPPEIADLVINTSEETVEDSCNRLIEFILYFTTTAAQVS